MKKLMFLLGIWMLTGYKGTTVLAQCAICTKTAQQLGDGPASGMNSGIIYLAFVPLLIIGYIGFRWWKAEKLRDK